MDVMPFFTWLEHSPLGQFAKLNDGIFVVAQSSHLISLALLGGTVLVTDLRLMNVILRNCRCCDRNRFKTLPYRMKGALKLFHDCTPSRTAVQLELANDVVRVTSTTALHQK